MHLHHATDGSLRVRQRLSSEDEETIMVISASKFPGKTGDSTRYMELLLSLRRRGLASVLICPPHRDSRNFEKEVAEELIDVVRIPIYPPRLSDAVGKGFRLGIVMSLLTFYVTEILVVLRAFSKYSIKRCVIRHSVLTLPLAPLLALLGVRSVADGEVVYDSLGEALAVPRYLPRLLFSVETKVLRFYDFYKVSTKSEAARMMKLGFHPSRVILSRVGIDLSKVPVYDLREIPPNTFGFYGALERWQALDLLMESFARVLKRKSSAKLLIIGDGSMKTELMRLSDRLGISGNVVFSDAVSRPVLLKEYFRMFRVVVIPLRQRRAAASPIKLPEALASGKPVIATSIEGVREKVVGGVLLVEEGNIDQMARAMISLCDDERLLLEMSDQAVKSAKEFDIGSEVDDILRAFGAKDE